MRNKDENIITGSFSDNGQLLIENYLLDDTLNTIQAFSLGSSNTSSVIAGDLMNIDGANEFDFVFSSASMTTIIYREKYNSAPYQTYENVCPSNPVCLGIPSEIYYEFDDDDDDVLNYSYDCDYTPGMNESLFDVQNATYIYADGMTAYCTYTDTGAHTFFIKVFDAHNHTINDTYVTMIVNNTPPVCYSSYETCTETEFVEDEGEDADNVTGIGETFTRGVTTYFGDDPLTLSIIGLFLLIFGVIFFGGLAFAVTRSALIGGIVTSVTAVFGVLILVSMGFLSFLYLFMMGLAMIIAIAVIVLWYMGGK